MLGQVYSDEQETADTTLQLVHSEQVTTDSITVALHHKVEYMGQRLMVVRLRYSLGEKESTVRISEVNIRVESSRAVHCRHVTVVDEHLQTEAHISTLLRGMGEDNSKKLERLNSTHDTLKVAVEIFKQDDVHRLNLQLGRHHLHAVVLEAEANHFLYLIKDWDRESPE